MRGPVVSIPIMRRTFASAVALAASAALLIGCAPTRSTTPTASPSSVPSSPAASTTPEVEPQIVVSLDGISVTDESGTSIADYDDPAAVLDLLEKTTGELPEPVKVEDPPGYEFELVNYTWDGLKLIVNSALEGPVSASITGPTLAGFRIATEDGFSVGSTRADLLDAGAWGLVDTEDPATAEYVGLGGREVAGAESLSHPGSVGILFTLFRLDGETVSEIQVPSNDFSDI